MSERGKQNFENRGRSFAPVFSRHSRALILGSYPSPKSFEVGYNYGHPQNRFWPLIAALAGRPSPTTLAERHALILESNLALWDSLESCQIIGASDASIIDPVPNDIPWLLTQAPIEAVFCNGAAAHRYYRLFCQEATGLAAAKLPSTSPANAGYRFERLLAAWVPLREYIRSAPSTF